MTKLGYTSVTDPVFSAEDGSTIDCMVVFPHLGPNPVPFTSSVHSPPDIGVSAEVYALALAGEFGPVAPYTPPSVDDLRAVMPSISARQLRLALIRNGLSLAAVDEAINAIPDESARDEARVEWEYATEFARLAPNLLQIAAALSLAPTQVDAMWEEAQTI